MKNFVIILIVYFVIFANPIAWANTCDCSLITHKDYVLKYYNYLCIESRNRAVIYNALNLSEIQINILEDITQKYLPIYQSHFKMLLRESKKLDSLEKSNVSRWNIYCQKRVLDRYYKILSSLYKQENNEFLKCLTKEQCKKYKEIKKLEYHDLKMSCKLKDYYKSNPKMKAFGDIKTFIGKIGSIE